MTQRHDPNIDPITLQPYAHQPRAFLVDKDSVTLKDAVVISKATVAQATIEDFQLKMKEGLAVGFAGVGTAKAGSIPPLPKRWYPDEFAGGLGRDDTIPTAHLATESNREPLQIAVTQRKIDELEVQIAALILEVSLYKTVDPYVIKLAKDNLTIGPTLLHKALSDLQLDDGK